MYKYSTTSQQARLNFTTVVQFYFGADLISVIPVQAIFFTSIKSLPKFQCMVYGCGCLFKMVWTPLALPKFSPHRNSKFLLYRKLYDTEIIVDYSILKCQLPAVRCVFFFLYIYIFQRNLTKWRKEQRKNELRIWDQEMKERRRKRKEEKKEGHTYTHPSTLKHQNSRGFTKSLRSARLPPDLVRQFANRQRSHRPSPMSQQDSLAPVIFFSYFF